MNKKHGLLFGFAVIAIAAIFTLTGCPTDSDDTGGGNGNTPTVTSVTVTAAGSVAKGQTLQFSAAVVGTNDPSQSVTWSITTTGIALGTTINGEGLLTVASAETKTPIEVKATSTLDDTKSGVKSVTVTPPPAPTAETFTDTKWYHEDYESSVAFWGGDLSFEIIGSSGLVPIADIKNPVFGTPTPSGDAYTVTYTGTLERKPGYSISFAQFTDEFPASVFSGATDFDEEVTFTFTYQGGNTIVLGTGDGAKTYTKSK
jgi:hypothetical protein